MAKNIDFMGATFPDVPSIRLPQHEGGLVSFDDTTDATATADKILQGYTAYANGQKLVGTASGGITPSGTISITQNGQVDVTNYATADVNVSGGGGGLPLIATKSLGTVSTTSTNETLISGMSIQFEYDDVNDYDLLLIVVSADEETLGHLLATSTTVFLYGSIKASNKNSHVTPGIKSNWMWKTADSIVGNANNTSYGIYAKSTTTTTGFALNFYSKYNSSRTGTIDGEYTARVYGVNIYDLI